MKPIYGASRSEAWLGAVQHLSTCNRWEDYNVVLEIEEPMRRNDADRHIEESVDEFLRKADKYPLNTVADTIFPASEYRRHGPEGVYEIYPTQIYPSIKRLPELKWGTYAHRLVRRSGPKGDYNPLQYCVEKIRRQVTGGATKTACYELSLSDVALDLPMYEPGVDRGHTIGGPCLSHVSVKLMRDKRVALTALYRSHFYVQKALGNLLGLARLQAFICEQARLPPGPLVCVSTYATLERESGKWTKANIETLVRKLSAPPRGARQQRVRQ